MKTRLALEACAHWLAYCVRIGWPKTDLDALEILWWKYHDENGNLLADEAALAAGRGESNNVVKTGK